MVTSEVEELIVKLHEAGKNMREISKHEKVRKNFTFIGAVLRKRFPEEYTDTDNSTITKETQALKLFSLRKTPTQAAIELNETPDSIEKYLWTIGVCSACFLFIRYTKKIKRLFPTNTRNTSDGQATITFKTARIEANYLPEIIKKIESGRLIVIPNVLGVNTNNNYSIYEVADIYPCITVCSPSNSNLHSILVLVG